MEGKEARDAVSGGTMAQHTQVPEPQRIEMMCAGELCEDTAVYTKRQRGGAKSYFENYSPAIWDPRTKLRCFYPLSRLVRPLYLISRHIATQIASEIKPMCIGREQT